MQAFCFTACCFTPFWFTAFWFTAFWFTARSASSWLLHCSPCSLSTGCCLQEKDPSADEAFAAAAALRQQSLITAAGDQSAAHAVDGFIPKPRPTNAFKAKASMRKQAASMSVSAATQTTVEASHGKDTNPARVTSVQAAAATPAGESDNTRSSCTASNSAEQENCTLFSDHNGSLLRRQHGAMTIGHSPNSAEQRHDCAQQPQGSPASHQPVVQSGGSSQPPLLGSLELEALPAGDPVISFEIDDADGPLEGAANDLSSQFGRLKVAGYLGYHCIQFLPYRKQAGTLFDCSAGN